jgi:hypothetical protein
VSCCQGYRLDALSLHLFPQSIPSDRVARQVVTTAIDLVYSITVDSHHLHAYTYYVSVKCGSVASTYRLRALAIHAALTDGGHVTGLVCPGAWTHHYFDVDSSAAHSDLQFRLRLSTGDVSYMTAHQHPPLKLRPPYRSVDHSAHSTLGVYTEASLCAVEEGKQFFALRGQGHCAEYELYLDVVSHDSTCAEMVHDCEGDDCSVQCDDIELDQFVYATCAPDSWYDFKLEVTSDNADSNLAVTAEDMSIYRTPEAISLHMYTEGEIPIDRHTEHRTLFAPDGVWGLGLGSHDLKPATYFFSVKCGAEPQRFRILAELIHAAVHEGDLITGEICPGQWMYHYYTADSHDFTAGQHLHVDFQVKLYTGDIEYMTRHGHPPIKLVPPYAETSATEQLAHGTEHVSICDVEHGTSYLGLHGGQHCAMYEVAVHLYTDSESSCTPQAHTGSADTHVALEELAFDHTLIRSCTAGGFVDFYVNIANQAGRSSPGVNLAVEIEDLSQHIDTEALGLYLYDGVIPMDRETELRQEYSGDGVYSVTVNANEIHAGRYFISVRCGQKPVRFRMLPHAIQAELYPGDAVSGSVCPGSAILHSFDVSHFPGVVVIESSSTGDSSSVAIGPTSGLNAVGLVASGLSIAGQDEAAPSVGAATSGSYTGASFAAHDFSGSHNEDLVLTVDGQDQTVTLDENIVHDTDAVAALSAGLTGVVVVLDHGNIVVTSSSTGTASSVVLDVAHSGAHAAGLFGSGAAVAGSDGQPSPATSGSYAGDHFHPYNFVGHEEELIVTVDGRDETIVLSTNMVDVDCALEALAGLPGAHASIHDGELKIESLSVGAHSSVWISERSGTHAQALFYDVCEEFEGSHDDVSLIGAVSPLVDGHFSYDSCIPGSLSTFSFTVTADKADSGFQITVEDTTIARNPSALGLYVYAGEVPDDMTTELKAEFSRDVSIN